MEPSTRIARVGGSASNEAVGLIGAPPASPFALDIDELTGAPGSRGALFARLALTTAAPLLERVLGLRALGQLYSAATGPALVEDFPERALAALGVMWRTRGPGAHTIPSDGPLVIVANHPFGAVDGLVLLALVRQVRRDVRLLGNYLLGRIPELRPALLEVDPFARQGAHRMNAKMVRRAVDWTRRGGALIVFPAGEVASVPAPGGRLIDAPWRHGAARIVAQSGADVVPVCFDGRNSRLFELAGRVHPLLRTVLLPRELLAQRGSSPTLTVGRPIPAARLDRMMRSGAAAVTSYLRARTYALAAPVPVAAPLTVAPEPIAEAASADAIALEVAGLPEDRTLLSQGGFRVLCISAQDAPCALREIGRVREIAFRSVGEGTGRALDIDRFDRHYRHLFVWHEERHEVVGAYRLAQTDAVTRAHGVGGLYTRTLFRYGRRFLHELGPAVELGRSFVRIECQREYLPLALLWRGILAFMAARPQYRRLIGPVSISASYGAVSRDVLVNWLEHPSFRSPLAALVRSRTPYRRTVMPTTSAFQAADVSDLLKEIESAGQSMPVLLRQYLKLHARTIATNVDPSFSNVVDALMVVDMDDVSRTPGFLRLSRGDRASRAASAR
jgi:putative hemolysin